ncbi:hypothetical protein TNCV_732861 [Trichonephila clavipes]|nr:hypothetical protein TNCV_732861 [Trichonephila clavipes]
MTNPSTCKQTICVVSTTRDSGDFDPAEGQLTCLAIASPQGGSPSLGDPWQTRTEWNEVVSEFHFWYDDTTDCSLGNLALGAGFELFEDLWTGEVGLGEEAAM